MVSGARLFACFLIAVSVPLSAKARGDEGTNGTERAVRLSVDSPADCTDRATFLAGMRRRTTRVREAAQGEAATGFRIQMVMRGPDYAGTLTVSDLDGRERRRELMGSDCRSVAAGLELVAALIVDPRASLATPTAVEATESPSTLPPGTSDKPSGLPSHGREPALRLGGGAVFEVASGLGPDAALVPRLFLDARLGGVLRVLSAYISVGRALARTVDTSAGNARIDLTDVRLEPCLAPLSSAKVTARACADFEAAILTGTGQATNAPAEDTRLGWEVGGSARFEWIFLSPLRVQIGAGLAAPLSRYRFYFEQPDTTAYRVAAFSTFGEVGLGALFW
jgi:hypothetical protein